MTSGLIVLSYGTPATPGEVEAYYTHIRRGRPPTPEQLADLRSRYEAIGGISPLAERTRSQTAALARRLDEVDPEGWIVTQGHKHATPFIEEGVAELIGRGVGRIVGVVLAPHYSAGSVAQYHQRAAEASTVPYAGVDSWWDLDPLLDYQAAQVRAGLDRLPDNTKVLFTAHSLPERVLVGDPYPDQLHASALATAQRVGLDRWAGWGLAWQSAGRTPEPWRGPDVNAVITDLAATRRAAGVLVCPQGFTSDHLEVRYDLDVEAAATAAREGLAFARTEPVGADRATMDSLADRARSRATAPG